MFHARSITLFVALFLGSLGGSVLLFHPTLREYSQAFIFPKHREILSVIRAEIDGKNYKLVKLRLQKRIYLEIYEWLPAQRLYEFIDRSQLTDSKDGFYRLQDERTNLFLKDIDGDSSVEIVVPSVDRNLISHLNIYKFSITERKLIKLSQH